MSDLLFDLAIPILIVLSAVLLVEASKRDVKRINEASGRTSELEE